ncbi:hypothetical protein QM012_001341 [Aureobasidium pullulans]|uniref:non-specific serine/threonine protein kinase n=1 Tax=Aureobasidium pullulans TaxID=5580 RepID=A0ABR0TEX6_AURPU
MAPKRPLEDEASAAPGAKKPRLESKHDDDEEMHDAPLESDDPEDADNVLAPEDAEEGEEEVDESETTQTVPADLDYEDGDFPDELEYEDNGKFFPGYHNPTAPTVAMPMISDAPPLPEPKTTLAAALPLPHLSAEYLFGKIRKILSKTSGFAAIPGSTLNKLSEKIRKSLLRFPEFAPSLILGSSPKMDEVVKLFQNVKRLDGNWIGVEGRLGKGGQGCARLFVRVDEQNRITKRIVVKDSCQNLATWADENWWARGRLGFDPRESIVNKLLSLPTPERWERYIVEYLGHSINHQWKTNRTYMEYCDGGDLHKLMKAQIRDRHVNLNYESGNSEYDIAKSVKVSGGEVIPEPFVWYYLKQMAIALHRMSNIPIRQNKGNFVVHKDIKPENIFLTSPDPKEFPKYPVCKLGDFGSAHVTFPHDPDNQEEWYDPVTPGFIPPEMDRFVYSETAWELTMATNVWQIAMTIVTLMRLERPKEIDYEDENLDLGEDFLHSLEDLKQDYSFELRSLLEKMLYISPRARPTPKRILERYFENKDKWEEMATAPSCNEFDLYPSWLHWSPSEDFQIHDFFDNTPSLPKKSKMTGGLQRPGSGDEHSSDDDEDDEHKGHPKAKKGIMLASKECDHHVHHIPHASGAHPEDEGSDEEDEEESEEEDDDEDEYEDEDGEGAEEEEGEEDYDEDDPMQGSSGPSLTSSSAFELPSEDRDLLMEGVSRGSGSF